ncbi:hypothetical protein ACIPY6_28850 [Streptomyces sp. NPDC090054]|uniref:hypothetical protein n=1 Tax=Streptomyces sp. NPDC090054 TaxID=3365933 RepID=UPI00381EBE4E
MTTTHEHQCRSACVCPVHGTPLLYSAAWGDHACQDGSCRYGGGFRAIGASQLFSLEQARRFRAHTS